MSVSISRLHRVPNSLPASEGPTRRPTVSCDPEVLIAYEYLVSARERVRGLSVTAQESGCEDWRAAAVLAEDLVDQAQRLLEALR